MRPIPALLAVVLLTAACADGPPGRSLTQPVDALFSGDTWRVVETGHHPLLAEGVVIETWALGEYRPPILEVSLNANGMRLSVESVADLRRHVGTIDTPRRAYEYSSLLRQFAIDGDEVPGLLLTHYAGNPYESAGMDRVADREAWGLGMRSMNTVRGAGFDATEAEGWKIPALPVITEDEDGYRIEHPVVVYEPGEAWGYRILHVRERIGRTGAYAHAIVRELQRGPHDVRRYVWLPR